ncbi:unnamed protein product [Rhizophagus irregularis]|nr:unnamed protein product [Rhizophagus irregularis]
MKQNLQILYCLGNETRIILKTSRENDYARKLLHKECFGNRSVGNILIMNCIRTGCSFMSSPDKPSIKAIKIFVSLMSW